MVLGKRILGSKPPFGQSYQQEGLKEAPALESGYKGPLARSATVAKGAGKLVKWRPKAQDAVLEKVTEAMIADSGPTKRPSEPIKTKRRHVAIAVMGITGVGKSSFIYKVTGDRNINIGNSLYSETSKIQSYRAKHGGVNYTLVDTPGFDDSHRSNDEIITQLIDWLETTFRQGMRLNGILYIHDIKKPRVQGSALQHMRMFRKVCGEDAMSHTVLVTSFWNQVDTVSATKREQQLLDSEDFWAPMVRKGAAVMRITDERSTCLAVLDRLAANTQVDMLVQHEIVKENKDRTDSQVMAESGEEQIRRVEAELQQMRIDERDKFNQQMERSQRRHERQMLKLQKKQDIQARKERERAERSEKEYQRNLQADQTFRKSEKDQLQYELSNLGSGYKHVWPCSDHYAALYGCNCDTLRTVGRALFR